MSKSKKRAVEAAMWLANINPQDVRFKVNRDGATSGVTGFTLMGVGETYAECYCLSFLTAQAKRKGNITFKDGKIHFAHGGINLDEADPSLDIYGTSEGGLFSTEISPEDTEELSQLLHGEGKYANAQIRVRRELAWGKGFTVYTKQPD